MFFCVESVAGEEARVKIKPFAVEEWMNTYETGAKYNIAETCVDSILPDGLFALAGVDKRAFLDDFCSRRLTYGDIEGAPAFRRGICSLYETLGISDVITTHGAAGANHHILYSLVEPGDHVISVMPTYQQLYSIPEGYGARVDILKLRPENGYGCDTATLRDGAECHKCLRGNAGTLKAGGGCPMLAAPAGKACPGDLRYGCAGAAGCDLPVSLGRGLWEG